jgi:uncharacterized protein
MTDDEEKLLKELSELPKWHKVAFAAACCERLLPNYLAFSKTEQWGDGDLLRTALDEIWSSLHRKSFDVSRMNQLITSCNEIIPDMDDFDSHYKSAALEASCAVVGTLETLLDKKAQSLIDVAYNAIETVYMYSQDGSNFTAFTPEEEELIHNHPLYITELKKLHDDLERLKAAPDLTSTFLQGFKENAKINGKSNLGL